MLGHNAEIRNTLVDVKTNTTHLTVKPGDSLAAIAKQHGTTIGDILRANPGKIAKQDLIFPGQKLNVPIKEIVSAKQPKQSPPAHTSGTNQTSQPRETRTENTSIINNDGSALPINHSVSIEQIEGVRGNPNVTPEFVKRVDEMAVRLKTKPEYLLAVMSFETGGSFSPSQPNSNGGSARGLIRFMPDTARGLGTSSDKLT